MVGAAKIYEGCWLRAAECGANVMRATANGGAVNVRRAGHARRGAQAGAKSTGLARRVAVRAAKGGR